MIVPARCKSVAGALAAVILQAAEDEGYSVNEGWPSSRYRDDPVRFAREVLGIEPWHRQAELLRAVYEHPRVAVAAGRKVSKSCSAAIIALWWFTAWVDAVVVMTSTTGRQLADILWRELRLQFSRSQRRLPVDDLLLQRFQHLRTFPIDGEPSLLAQNGLKSGHRVINGFSAKEGVAAAGISGAHLLYLVDEASGVEQHIFDAIIGNMAGGGGRLVLFGNPTRCEGEFFDAFNTKHAVEGKPGGYHTLTISSEESPNVIENDIIIPGLAYREWIEERKSEWGEDSPLYKIHVKGEFVREEEGKINSLALIQEATLRWSKDDNPEGVLHIGVDPAMSDSGDEAAFAVRRGSKILGVYGFRGLSAQDHLVHLRGYVQQFRRPRDAVPIVVADALGDVGRKVVLDVLTPYAREHQHEFVLVQLRGSDIATRDPVSYWHIRDELWGNFSEWLKNGGSIPEDLKLQKDLHAPSWSVRVDGKKIVTSKDDMRKTLGRSPDRGDAVCLCCWDRTRLTQPAPVENAQGPDESVRRDYRGQGYSPDGIDYAGSLDWLKQR